MIIKKKKKKLEIPEYFSDACAANFLLTDNSDKMQFFGIFKEFIAVWESLGRSFKKSDNNLLLLLKCHSHFVVYRSGAGVSFKCMWARFEPPFEWCTVKQLANKQRMCKKDHIVALINVCDFHNGNH